MHVSGPRQLALRSRGHAGTLPIACSKQLTRVDLSVGRAWPCPTWNCERLVARGRCLIKSICCFRRRFPGDRRRYPRGSSLISGSSVIRKRAPKPRLRSRSSSSLLRLHRPVSRMKPGCRWTGSVRWRQSLDLSVRERFADAIRGEGVCDCSGGKSSRKFGCDRPRSSPDSAQIVPPIPIDDLLADVPRSDDTGPSPLFERRRELRQGGVYVSRGLLHGAWDRNGSPKMPATLNIAQHRR
jgi:hypothetical protein